MTPIEIYAMLQRKINEGGYGSPLVASLAENMTDQNRVYVYTGSETGMETGHWYYYDGEDWADGGVYNSIAVQTDKNLTQENKAADGKATGDAIAANTTLINQNAGEISQLKSDLTNIDSALPKSTTTSSYLKIEGTTANDDLNLEFTASEGNRVYCGGKNLFDGEIQNFAFSNDTIITGSTYRGFACPIKGGKKYTISRSAKSSGRFRIGATVDYPANDVVCVAQPEVHDDSTTVVYDTANHPEAKWLAVYLSNSSDDVSGTNFWVVEGETAGSYEAYNGTLTETDASSMTGKAVSGTTYCWCDSGNISLKEYVDVGKYIDDGIDEATLPSVASSNTGNFSIVCAKEHSYIDGSNPVIEYFLIEECTTQKFYISKDLKEKQCIFTFDGTSRHYAFGIMQNGDIIACKLADALESGKDDSHRENPYCWLASEKWAVQHEVEFPSGNIPPCGWLSNCGFKTLADGTSMFVEYTRMTVATANVWKLSGSPADPSNWSIVKSFNVTTEDEISGFKHIHMVIQDQYTGIIYISTGDDDNNAMIFYSSDDGTTWTQLGTPSQKYCRNLMFTFTESYIYWAPDTTADSARYLFRTGRDANGVLDFANIADYIHIGAETGNTSIAAYGTAYIPELNAILVLDRSDGMTASIPVKLIDLDSETCEIIGTLYAPSETQQVGFRTRFSEWYPINGKIRFGFGFATVGQFNNANHIKGFDNAGYSNTGVGTLNINNLVMQIFKANGEFGFAMSTLY